jgi:hypothetical protein
MTVPEIPAPDFRRLRGRALIVGIIGIAIAAAGLLTGIVPFFRAWLVAWLFWCGIAAGALALIMVHHIVGGGWGFVIRRPLEAAALTLPLCALLAIPLIFGAPFLYPWMHASSDPAFAHARPYLNVPFFAARFVFYLALWSGMAWWFARASRRQDRTGDPSIAARFQAWSGPGLVVWFFTVTFASVDWIMSLEPGWRSTVFGMIVIAGQGLAAYALMAALVSLFAPRTEAANLLPRTYLHDLGNLMLTFVLLWAYTELSQYLIIWSGNLAAETPWYVHRSTHGWNAVSFAVVVLNFGLPFLILLSSAVKRSRALLLPVAGLVLAGHFLDTYWMVVPSIMPSVPTFDWVALTAVVGMGGLWMAAFTWILEQAPLLPLRDPRLEEYFREYGPAIDAAFTSEALTDG